MGPRTQISPGSPTSASSPEESTSRTSTPGSGTPMLPAGAPWPSPRGASPRRRRPPRTPGRTPHSPPGPGRPNAGAADRARNPARGGALARPGRCLPPGRTRASRAAAGGEGRGRSGRSRPAGQGAGSRCANRCRWRSLPPRRPARDRACVARPARAGGHAAPGDEPSGREQRSDHCKHPSKLKRRNQRRRGSFRDAHSRNVDP